MAKSSMPTVKIRVGTILTRVHREGVDPLWFGNRDQTWRWDASIDAEIIEFRGSVLTTLRSCEENALAVSGDDH